MLNPDRSNHLIYTQVPFQASHQTGMAAAGGPDNNDLDLAALNQRLRTLGLHHSTESINLPNIRAQPNPSHLLSPLSPPRHHQRQPTSARSDPQFPPTIAELGPSDSISMYRHAMPHSDRGGTNVDPGEHEVDHYESYGTPGQETRRSPPLDDEYFEQMTMGQSQWNATNVNNMQAMRDRLVNEQANPGLVTALAKLEASEEQLRSLQATLIAERVARTQIEQQAQTAVDDMRDYRHELASAVRALRRARDEGKKNEEERRRLQRSFEEAQKSLNVYNTALEVRKAREQGRVEGREEAWAEAGRWMGHSPPIPVEPIQAVPDTVLRQTPGPRVDASHLPPTNTQTSGHDQHITPQHMDPRLQGGNHPFVPPGAGQPPFGAGGYPPVSHPVAGQQGQNGHSMMPTVAHDGRQAFHGPANGGLGTVNAVDADRGNGKPFLGAQSGLGHQQGMPATGLPGGTSGYPVPHHGDPGDHQPGLPDRHPLGNNRPAAQPGLSHSKSQASPQRTNGPGRNDKHRRSHSLTVPPRNDTTDSFLDRVDNDPRLKSMLSGAPSKTIHTSVPVTGSSAGTAIDKPLPNVHGKSKRSVSQRHSLMDGLHGGHATAHISTGDRYPTFPVNGKGHSRQSSFNSADLTRRHLEPHNGSAFTPLGSRGRHRSRVAGALRANNELEQLSSIDEEQNHALPAPPPPPAPAVDLTRPRETQYYASKSQPKPQGRYAPSMPPMRARPIPVMPQPLGRSGSEPRESTGRMPLQRGRLDPVPMQMGQYGAEVSAASERPRHSALGLEGMTGMVDSNHATMKPPTIMIQPPSSRSNNKSEVRSVLNGGAKSVPPHDIPLPPSARPHDIPLPPPNAQAPTAYTPSAFSPDRPLPNVNIIDYASRQPLPHSRPTTYFANTIATELDAEGFNGHVHARKQVSIPHRKPALSDPRQVPLPPSRAGTRARTSRTIPTIDEVTEEESGKENYMRRRRM